MWQNPLKTADLVIFTEEILNGNLHFLCSVIFPISFLHTQFGYNKYCNCSLHGNSSNKLLTNEKYLSNKKNGIGMSLDFQFQVFVLFTFVHLTCYLGSLQWIWASLQLVQLDFYGVFLLPCRHLFVRYLFTTESLQPKFILTFLYQKELEWSISV